jgi:predicted ATPase
VKVAVRSQALAEAGQVVGGLDTYFCARDTFSDTPGCMDHTRGLVGSHVAWIAVDALAPPRRRRRRRQRTPLIGRDAELGMLRNALSVTVARNRPHVVVLLGEAGVGKSRLAEEVSELAGCDHDALVLEGRCVPYGEANAWWPIAEAVRQLCEITDEDDAESALAKSRRGVIEATGLEADDPETERLATGLFYLMGQEGPLAEVEPLRAAAEARRAVETVLRGLARRRPVVVILSELHWADTAVLELVDELLGRSVNLPVLVLATARPEIESRWVPKPGPYNMVTLHVDALDRDASESLLSVLLESSAPDDLRDALLERSGGNPFFLEELVSLLTDAGMVGDGDGGRTPVVAELPATLRGLVAARLDALTPAARATVEDAAVLGRTGRVEALDAMAAARHADAVHASGVLDDLVARDLLAADGAEWSFRSDMMREVSYDTLTKAERARRHFAVADWLSARRKELGREDEELEQIAHHFAAAAELAMELGDIDGLPADIRPRALRAIEKAAHRAKQRELGVVGVRLLDRALRLRDPDDSLNRKRVLIARARALTSMRHLDDARRDVDDAIAEAERDDDTYTLACALNVLGDVQQKEAALDESASTLERALGLWQQLDDERGRADALRVLGMTRLFGGDPDAAEEPISEALAAFKKVGCTKTTSTTSRSTPPASPSAARPSSPPKRRSSPTPTAAPELSWASPIADARASTRSPARGSAAARRSGSPGGG